MSVPTVALCLNPLSVSEEILIQEVEETMFSRPPDLNNTLLIYKQLASDCRLLVQSTSQKQHHRQRGCVLILFIAKRYIRSSRAFIAAYDDKFDFLTFKKCFEVLSLKGREMHENIFAAIYRR